jgi:hypothetical protein
MPRPIPSARSWPAARWSSTGCIKTTPRVIKTTPRVIKTTPHVIKTTPHVIKTTPHVIKTTPHVIPRLVRGTSRRTVLVQVARTNRAMTKAAGG